MVDIVTDSVFPNEPNELYNCKVESEPLNQFNTPYLSSMSFLTLFPDLQNSK